MFKIISTCTRQLLRPTLQRHLIAPTLLQRFTSKPSTTKTALQEEMARLGKAMMGIDSGDKKALQKAIMSQGYDKNLVKEGD